MFSIHDRNITGKFVDFREIKLDDAEFVLSLRLDPDLNKYLSETNPDLIKQRKWIEKYLENNSEEWYFIIQNKKSEPIGTVRIYDIKGDSFCWGSWIIKPSERYYASFEACIMLYEYAFYTLGFERSHWDVRKENQKIINFHERFGAKIVKEDELNYYYIFEKEVYDKNREKYLAIIDSKAKMYEQT